MKKQKHFPPPPPFSFILHPDIAVRLDDDDSMLVKSQVTSRFPGSNFLPSKTDYGPVCISFAVTLKKY
jgi:hypothetical protein